MNKITVIFHSADFDGIFCREIARKFLPPDTTFIGWDYRDKKIDPITVPAGLIYILDLSPECFEGTENGEVLLRDRDIIWIDHHKSAIEKFSSQIPGYRIDGVAACRLAWQWFFLHQNWDHREQHPPYDLPSLQDFIDRKVAEPLAVRLAGEYDIWDKRDENAELFQFGLDSLNTIPWDDLLNINFEGNIIDGILMNGVKAKRVIDKRNADMMKGRSFKIQFEGMKFLCLNIARCNSQTFESLDIPETGHDALMGYFWNGKVWTFSLYHAKHKTDIDLSAIAKKFKGGGHRGACGFTVKHVGFDPRGILNIMHDETSSRGVVCR